MERRRRRIQTHVLMRNIVITSSVVSSVINLTVLAISASAGEWLFGQVFCQLYGLLSQVLISGSAWMVALAAIERCYSVLAPAEHPATFSNTNMKIMVLGLYLILMVLHTSPLYGWGEYSFHRGGIELYIGMTDKIQENITQGTMFNKFILIDEKTTEVLNSSTSSHESALQAQLDSQKPDFNPPNIAMAIKTFLENEFDCGARTIMKSSLIIILRFSKLSSLQMFQEKFYQGTVIQDLEKYLLTQFSTTNGTLPSVEFEFDVQEEALRHYRDVHLTFQDLGLCALDFSPVNPSITSWIPFTILINITPYIAALACGCVLHKLTSSTVRQLNANADFYVFCSLTGIVSVIPYYYVNIQNYQGSYVDRVINLFVTVLYFTSTLSYILTFVCFGCCLQSTFLDTYSQKNNYDNSESEENSNKYKRRTLRQQDSGTGQSGNSDMSNEV